MPIQIGTATLALTEQGCVSSYPDASSYGAYPHNTPHYHVIAHRCGYGDDLRRYCVEHEAAHHIVSEWIVGHPSHVIWSLAHGDEPHQGVATLEEMAAQQFQRWLRANERPSIGGADWDDLKHRALVLLDAL